VLIIVAAAIVVIIVGLIVADSAIRAYAEGRVEQEIQTNLPSNVTGDVHVTIGGTSVIGQYLAGSFSSVTLNAPDLTVDGSPVAVSVVASGVPTDLTKPVQDIHGTITVDEDTVNKYITIPNATGGITLGSGTATYDGKTKLIGLPVSYEVTVKPKANGDTVLLEPTDVRATSGFLSVNLTSTLRALFGTNPVPVCVASSLPQGVQVTDIVVTPGHATITLDAKNLVLSEQALSTKGSCS
jgi:LmeA-like phospholipid-binding